MRLAALIAILGSNHEHIPGVSDVQRDRRGLDGLEAKDDDVPIS